MAYRQTNDPFTTYGSSYPYTSCLSAYSRQQDLDPESPEFQPDLTTEAAGAGWVNPNSRAMQSMPLASLRPGHRRSFSSSLSASAPSFSTSFNQQPILAPSTRRLTNSSLDRILEIDPQERSSALVPASEGVTAIDKLILPSEMPIGSLVHIRGPQEWGVVKIANIPYSITKQEIVHFLGRQARLIGADKGCPVHIIMERSTAKTMDCYVEFESVKDAEDTVYRVNKISETGRAPRLGNRVVYVEVSNQDELLQDLFPRTKCVKWKNGFPIALPNIDPYSTGFAGFFTSEEILGAIRHAEIPHRSPFCAKCPQRTYESTISTLHKFPWYATKLYTVHERNTLFEMANRHIKSLAYRLKSTKTIGLDQRLLRDLLYAGLNCPAFNERQKFTLCMNSEEIPEILKFPDMGKWFPFDTLVKMPRFGEDTLLYYASLISKGSLNDKGNPDLPNIFPRNNYELKSPYGQIWFEWPLEVAKSTVWEDAVQREMANLCNLVSSGYLNRENECNTFDFGHLSLGSTAGTTASSSQFNTSASAVSPLSTENTQFSEEILPPPGPLLSSKVEIYATPRRARNHQHGYSTTGFAARDISNDADWSDWLVVRPPNTVRGNGGNRPGYLGHHRNTLSSPCFMSKENY